MHTADDERFFQGWPKELTGYIDDADGIIKARIEEKEIGADLVDEVEMVAVDVADAFRIDLERWLRIKYA
jgi:hypothetical protein